MQAWVGTAAHSESGECQRLDVLDGTVEFPDLWVSSYSCCKKQYPGTSFFAQIDFSPLAKRGQMGTSTVW